MWVTKSKYEPKTKRARKNAKNIFEAYKETNIVEYWPMINELHKRTGVPAFICSIVYDAEEDILTDLGIIKK